jgi:pyridoxine kinase
MAKPILFDMLKTVLSISSQVAFGPVGNSAAVPAMEAFGVNVYAVPTIILSHHPGHAKPASLRVPAFDLAAIIDSLQGVGALDGLAAVLTGYFAASDQIFAVAQAIRQLKESNPGLFYLCDPVLGAETSQLYVPLPVAEAVKSSLLPLADVVTPNAFELEWLSGCPIESVNDVGQARIKLGQGSLLAKSIRQGDDRLLTVLTGALGEATILSRRRKDVAHGTGDVLSGLFLANLLNGFDGPSALKRALGVLETIIDASAGSPALDLSLLKAVKTQ